MKRNGLVFVPREPPKRVILYPTQDSASQQQQPNGLNPRAKTALVTDNHNETTQQSNNNNNIRLSRQQPVSSPPNGATKLNEKSDNDGTISATSGQPISVNGVQKTQNPYYANPFFRPKVITNTNPLPPSRDSSTATNVTIQTISSASAVTLPNRGRQLIYPKEQNPNLLTNGRTHDSEVTTVTTSAQEDGRRWAHAVASAPIARRTINDERQNATLKPSETNITNQTSNDTFKPKGTSATDIVISLMETWRAPMNPGSTSTINILTRTGGIKDDSTLTGQTSTLGEQLPGTPPFLTTGTAGESNNNNQNWKKALVANFQKNSRNIPTAKLFTSKQTAVPPPQPTTTVNNNTTVNQQQKSDRTMIFNNERTFQPSENTPTIPSLMRKSSEIIRPTKQDTNTIERSTSLQIQAPIYPNPVTTTATNKTEERQKPVEIANSENASQVPISIPSALITPKPPANVEQQRAIITRVMIRRDFVKSNEARPAMPVAPANIRSYIPPQSAKPGGLPTNNVIQVANIAENNTITNLNLSPNRSYPLQPQQQQQQQSMPLSQKSLLAFTSNNPTVRETVKVDNNQQQLNGLTNDGMTASSIMKMQQSQGATNNVNAFRSNSLSAANAESRRKKEEIINKPKKRAISASAASNDG